MTPRLSELGLGKLTKLEVWSLNEELTFTRHGLMKDALELHYGKTVQLLSAAIISK